MKWAGHAACMGEMRNSNKILVGEPDGKRQLWRQKCRWENNINMFPTKRGQLGDYRLLKDCYTHYKVQVVEPVVTEQGLVICQTETG